MVRSSHLTLDGFRRTVRALRGLYVRWQVSKVCATDFLGQASTEGGEVQNFLAQRLAGLAATFATGNFVKLFQIQLRPGLAKPWHKTMLLGNAKGATQHCSTRPTSFM